MGQPKGGGLCIKERALGQMPPANWVNGERLAALEERMQTVEEGIKNFRDFHSDVRDFISRSDERAKMRAEEEKRKDKWTKAIIALAIGIILALFGYVLQWTQTFESKHHVSSTPMNYESR